MKTNLQSAFTSRSCIRFQIRRKRPEVEKRIAELQTLIEQERQTKAAPPEGTLQPKPPLPTEPPAQTTTVPAIAAHESTDIRTPWYRDAAAMTMAAIGVAALGAGVGLVVKGNLDLSNATTAADLQDHDNLRSSGTTFSAAGYASLGVGAALCIAAAVKWAVRPKRQRVAFRIMPSRSGATAGLGGAF